MADIDDVLERLVTDPEFRARLAADPTAALSGYELSPAERELLATAPDDGSGDLPHGVEQRTSKSALVGLLASFAPGPDITPVPEPAARPELEEVSFTFHKIDMDTPATGDLAAPVDSDETAILLPAVQKVRDMAPRIQHSEVSEVADFTVEETSADAGGSAPPEPDTPPLREPTGDGRDTPAAETAGHDVAAQRSEDILTQRTADAPPRPPDEDFLTVSDA